jgi:hypothetical protein
MPHNDQLISLEKAYEVRHWSRELDWNEAELYTAVRNVGKGLTALRAHRRTTGPSVRAPETKTTLTRCEPRQGKHLFLVR